MTLKEDASSLYLFTEYTHFTQNYTSSSPTDYIQRIGRKAKLEKKVASLYVFTSQNGLSQLRQKLELILQYY